MPSLSQKRVSERHKLADLPPSADDPHKNVNGVLLRDEIQFYVRHCHLIRPFDPKNLKPAGYELTVGNEYFISGEFLTLDADSNQKGNVVIPPFQVAVLKTAEILCIPRYLIARWNIRVTHAYSGLLWVGGPQVDPGYVGHLFCPIYNLSDREVTLHLGEAIALIDFVKTTPFDSKSDSEFERYPFPPKRVIMPDYGIDELRSALFTKAGERLVEFEQEIRNQTTRVTTFIQISFAIFALMIAMVAIISRTNAENLAFGTAILGGGTIAISVFAVLIALSSHVGQRVGRLVYEQYGRLMGKRASRAVRFIRRAWWLGIAVSVFLSLAGGYVVYCLIDPLLVDYRQRPVLTKSDLGRFGESINAEVRKLSDRVQRLEKTQAGQSGAK